MNPKLAKILTGLLSLFICVAIGLWVGAFGFKAPEAGTHVAVKHPEKINWSFDGPRGTFDKASIQRGYKVYKEVCASCHSMDLVAFRNLKGAGFSDAEIKALAAEYTYPSVGEDGSNVDRKGIPSDKLKHPYENPESAAAANGGAVPPDLSLMAKAREDAPNYVYSLMVGYGKTTDYVCTEFSDEGNCIAYKIASDNDRAVFATEQKKRDELVKVAEAQNAELKKANKPEVPVPAFRKDNERKDVVYKCIPHDDEAEKNPHQEIKSEKHDGSVVDACHRLPDGKYFNRYFPGKVIAMPEPLKDGQVDYEDGTKNDVAQQSKDIVNFLQYVAEPEMELRKRMGIKVIIFLSIMTIFFYIAKVRIWARVK